MPPGRDPDFLKLWIGQTISEICSRISRDGLPMTAVMLLGASPWEMGILSAAGTASVLAFGLVAGLIADRMRRRPLMIVTDVARALLLTTVPLAAWAGVLGMPQLLAVTTIAGLLTVLFDVAYQTYLPSLVGQEELLEGNRRLGMSVALAEMVGPGMTGVLVSALTAPVAIFVDAGSFLVSAVSLASIRRAEPPPSRVSTGMPSRAELFEGFRIIRSHPVLRALLLRTVTAWLFGGIVMPLYVLLAIRELRFTPIEFGFTVAMGGTGAMVGAWMTQRVAVHWPPWKMFFVSALVSGVAFVGMPLAAFFPRYGLVLLCAQQLIGDGAYSFLNVSETTFRQTVVDGAVLGRANGAMQIASRGVLPVGALLGGFLAESVGVGPALAVGACGFILASFWLLPLRKVVTQSETHYRGVSIS